MRETPANRSLYPDGDRVSRRFRGDSPSGSPGKCHTLSKLAVMSIETGKIQGPLVLEEDLQLQGTVIGDVTVCRGAHFQLNGTVTGRVTVDDGAKCDVNGTVDSVVAAGVSNVRGVVIRRATGAGLVLHRGAVVNGVRRWLYRSGTSRIVLGDGRRPTTICGGRGARSSRTRPILSGRHKYDASQLRKVKWTTTRGMATSSVERDYGRR